MDETLETPILETGNSNNKEHFTECFVGNDGILRHDYTSRLYRYTHNDRNDVDKAISSQAFAGICPDFVLN
jgi:hypothetical protein